MIGSTVDYPYSFSMVNLVKLMQDWNWSQYDRIMLRAGTNRTELVPGMLFGADWDYQIGESLGFTDALIRLTNAYTVSSIQSLTFGLDICLAEPLTENKEVVKRFQALACLGALLKCNVFVLGSPAHKKIRPLNASPISLRHHFMDNCRWMASVLGSQSILSLEHNTATQGAEFCNTLKDIVDLIQELRQYGVLNIGLNLDTKCLMQEFGDDFNLSALIFDCGLRHIVTSIQVSHDFLRRSVGHARSDEASLLKLAQDQACPISLEEFGIIDNQLDDFIISWRSVLSTQHQK
jgi:hypothetical protein